MIRPKLLTFGDTIALIAPASPTTEEKLHSAILAIEALGLKVKIGESCKSNKGFLAGDDQLRAYDINSNFEDKNVKGIFALRGGYGCTRLLDFLDYSMISKNPKVFIGYSDLTALHIVLNQKCNLITYHGPMASTELNKNVDSYTLNYLSKTIFETDRNNIIDNPTNIFIKTLHPGKVSGILTGGNLSVICSTLGTNYEIDTKNKILFLEDIGEEPYKIDRMLTQLKQCGKFEDSQGIILGKFTNCNPCNPSRSLSLEEVLTENILSLNKPAICNLQCGHCLPTLTLPLGENIFLDATQGSIMII